MTQTVSSDLVHRFGDSDRSAVASLVKAFGVTLVEGPHDEPIPYSYWGDPEAGVRDARLFVRCDTPLHSILHELSHVICMSDARRGALVRDAEGDDLEESAVCYLQILLAEEIPGFGRARMMDDMDRWGYSFRLGSTARWFEKDAADAIAWLRHHSLVDAGGRPSFRLR